MAFIDIFASRSRTGKQRRRSPLDLMALYRSRHALTQLDQHLLEDIGLSQSEATHEAERPMWDVPSNWRR